MHDFEFVAMERKMNFIPIRTIVDYWQQFWIERVNALIKAENFEDIAKSPRLLLNDILLEIKYNGFRNENNWKLFRTKLEFWRNNEPVFKKIFNKECGIILSDWRHKPHITSSICNSILAKMDDGEYYEAVIDKLIKCLQTPTDFSFKNKEQIQIYSDIIIVELIQKGYILRDISNAIYHPDILMTDVCTVAIAPDELCGYKQKNYTSKEEYYETLTNYFKNLSVKDKVKIIDLHYNKQPVDAIVLVRLTEIKGDIDAFIDGINICSLNKKNLLDKEFSSLIRDKETVYAAIPVKHKMPNSSISYAIDRLKRILSLLQLKLGVDSISYSKENIVIILNRKIIHVSNIPLRTPDVKDNNLKMFSYPDISEYIIPINKLSEQIIISKRLSNSDFIRLNNSAKWVHNAKNAQSSSDKLLYSWIAIESIIKLGKEYNEEFGTAKEIPETLTIAQKIIVPIALRYRFYNYMRIVFETILWDVNSGYNSYGISEKSKNRLYQNSDNGFPLSNLFACIDELINETNDESFRNELQNLTAFYKKEGIEKFELDVSSELTLIYRLRNMIVHNAVYSTYEIKYYANRAVFYASCLLSAILTVSSINQLNMTDSIIKIMSDGLLFNKEIEMRINNLYNNN